jgi:Tfp pilus assembly protein PilF
MKNTLKILSIISLVLFFLCSCQTTRPIKKLEKQAIKPAQQEQYSAHDYITDGFGYVKKRQLAEAIICFSKAIELEPENPYAYGFRGECL